MIILSPEPAQLTLAHPDAVCVYHKTYTPPKVAACCEVIPWDDFSKNAKGLMRDRRTLILVGLNRIITPANRTDEVFEFLFNQSQHLHKISVDRSLFVGVPWRLWFHFGFCGLPYREYTYSYLAESHWKAAVDGLRPDPFDLDTVLEWGRNHIHTSSHQLFREIKVTTQPVTTDIQELYQAEKTLAFEEENNLSRIVQRLSRVAAHGHKGRSIPSTTRLFDRPAWDIHATDLPVDQWLVKQLLGMVDFHNDLYEACYDSSL